MPIFQCAYVMVIWYKSVNSGVTKGFVGGANGNEPDAVVVIVFVVGRDEGKKSDRGATLFGARRQVERSEMGCK